MRICITSVTQNSSTPELSLFPSTLPDFDTDFSPFPLPRHPTTHVSRGSLLFSDGIDPFDSFLSAYTRVTLLSADTFYRLREHCANITPTFSVHYAYNDNRVRVLSLSRFLTAGIFKEILKFRNEACRKRYNEHRTTKRNRKKFTRIY